MLFSARVVKYAMFDMFVMFALFAVSVMSGVVFCMLQCVSFRFFYVMFVYVLLTCFKRYLI